VYVGHLQMMQVAPQMISGDAQRGRVELIFDALAASEFWRRPGIEPADDAFQVLRQQRVRRTRERDDDPDEDHLARVGVRVLRPVRPARQPLLAARRRCGRCCRHGGDLAATPGGGPLIGVCFTSCLD